MAVNDPYSAYRRQVQITQNVNNKEQSELKQEVLKPVLSAVPPVTSVAAPLITSSAVSSAPGVISSAATTAYAGRSQAQYLETRVLSATPAELTLMLYDGAIRFMSQYIVFVGAKDIQAAHNAIMRAQDIVSELLVTLDMKHEIADGMASIYVYCIERLTAANVKKEVEPVQEVIELIRELRNTWAEAMKICKAEQPVTQPGNLNVVGG